MVGAFAGGGRRRPGEGRGGSAAAASRGLKRAPVSGRDTSHHRGGGSDPRGGTEGRGFTLGSSSHRATWSPCQAGVATIFTPGPLAIGHRCAGAEGASQCGPTSGPEGALGSASPPLDLQRLPALPSRAPSPGRAPPRRNPSGPSPLPAAGVSPAPSAYEPSVRGRFARRVQLPPRRCERPSPPRPPPAGPPPTPTAPPRTCPGAGLPVSKSALSSTPLTTPAGLFPGSRHSLRRVFQQGPVPRHVRPAVTNFDLLWCKAVNRAWEVTADAGSRKTV